MEEPKSKDEQLLEKLDNQIKAKQNKRDALKKKIAKQKVKDEIERNKKLYDYCCKHSMTRTDSQTQEKITKTIFEWFEFDVSD